MKLKFNFHCDRPVPYYAHRCNQLLTHPQVLTTGKTDNTYFFIAEGDQEQLSELAEQVGQEWSLSCWLERSELLPVEELEGDEHALAHGPVHNPYCGYCRDHLQTCHHCGSEAQPSLDSDQLQQAVDTFLAKGQCTLATGSGLRRFRRLGNIQPKQLMFCRAEALNTALHLSNQGVRLLSSLEKPMLQLLPKAEFAKANTLAHITYLCHLADDRISLRLAQKLADAGVELVAVEEVEPAPKLVLTFLEEKPLALSHRTQPGDIACPEAPLWDDAVIGGYRAEVNDGKLLLSEDGRQNINDRWAAACAHHGATLFAPRGSTTATLYLSGNRPSGLIHQDDQGEYQWLVKLPEKWIAPNQILNAIAESAETGERLVARFRELHPERAATLDAMSDTPISGNLSSVMALIAWLLQVAEPGDDRLTAARKFTALALGHDGKNSPRIDFKLKRDDDEVLTVQPHKALQAALSYAMADENSIQATCYGLVDSFADFVANWVEQLDADVGIDQLALAGDEFASPALMDRIHRRLGNNFHLMWPEALDFDGSNLAAGGLFLKRRKRA
ncbi:hypothetical protein [Ferrimonas futtsuensis]|uniref:hypothetical protein n=1 Tax=Ferrimonas futtsuensis TaxID=364764 RepID=UPI000428598A|nr:hypothetical protein [Ferrimonas futtsuensis]